MKLKDKVYFIGFFLALTSVLVFFSVALQGCGKKEGDPIIYCKIDDKFKNFQMFSYKADQDSQFNAVAGDNKGNIFAVGYGTAEDGTEKVWITARSSDGGAKWDLKDVFKVTDNSVYAAANGIYVDGNTIMVVGYHNNGVWTVRRSQDSGENWSTVDSYALVDTKTSEAQRITKGADGNYYVVGYADDASDNAHGIVRRSTDGGTTWSSYGNFVYETGANTVAYDVAVNAGGEVFVAIYALDGAGVSWAIVNKRANEKLKWENADKYRLASNKRALAYAIEIDSKGNIVYGGFADDANNNSRWFVRRSTDSGKVWTTTDMPTDIVGIVQDFAIDNQDNIYAIGYYYTTLSDPEYTIRIAKSTNAGASFSAVDTYRYNSDGNSVGFGLGFDSFGNIFATGFVSDNGGLQSGLLRRALCKH